jgi:dTDP-4-dehydrorhamnose reductase
MRVFLAGGSGQLGSVLRTVLEGLGGVLAPPRAELDLTDPAAVRAAVLAFRPKAVVNASGFNDVDAAEEKPFDALQLNALAVRSLARAADEAGALLVHFGTDFVFDGRAARPYVETDAPNPRSVYGVSKLAGEDYALAARHAWVLRVESLFGGPRAKSTIDRIAAALSRGEQVRAFSDRVVTPSFVLDVAAATRAVLEKRPAFGLYHCVGTGETTWLELAREAERLLGRSGLVTPATAREVALKAERPLYCALSNAKLAAAGVPMPRWQDALRRAFGEEEA